MALKRKFESEDAEEVYQSNNKQMKLVPFPSAADNDVDMSDAPMYDLQPFHRDDRLLSTTSSNTSGSPAISPGGYPVLELYPDMGMNGTNFGPPSPVGLLQPTAGMSINSHQFCTQIPKLKVACASGTNGRRMMYTLCEECGSIEMVDSD